LLRVLSTLPRYGLIVHVYPRGSKLFTIDKLMSGSSLEGKAFFKKPQTRNSKAFYFRQICSIKPWSLKPSTSGLAVK